MNNEIKPLFYKEIPGYKGYFITTDGVIVSKKRKTSIVMKQRTDKDGYKEIGLFDENHKKNYKRVHRLVAKTYIENPDNKPVINHINGIKNDNRVNNLEWCTIKENNQHQFDCLGRKGNITTNKLCDLYNNDKYINSFNSILDAVNHAVINYPEISKSSLIKYKKCGNININVRCND